MLSLFSSPYHKDKESFGSKAWSLGKFGAIVSAAYLGKSHIHGFVGAASESAITKISEGVEWAAAQTMRLETQGSRRLFGGLLKANQVAAGLNSFFKFSNRTIKDNSLLRSNSLAHTGLFDLLSESSAAPAIQGTMEIRRIATKRLIGEKRINAFLSTLQNRGAISGLTDDRSMLNSRLGLVARAESSSDFLKLSNTEGINSLKKVFAEAGVRADGLDHNTIHEALLASKNARVDAGDLSKVLGGITNKRNLVELLVSETKRSSVRSSKLNNLVFPHSRQLSIGEIRKAVMEQGNDPINTQLRSFFEKRGFSRAGQLEDAFLKLDDVVGKALKYGDNPTGSAGSAEITKLQDAINESFSGFVVTKAGKLVNVNEQKMLANRAMDFVVSNKGLGLQLPIFPGLMDVPANIFRFARPDKSVVKSLGLLGEQPELMRHGVIKNIAAQDSLAQAFSVGDKLMTLARHPEGYYTMQEHTGFTIQSFRKKGPESARIVKELAEIRLQEQKRYTIQDAKAFKGDSSETWWQEAATQKFEDLFDIAHHGAGRFGVVPKNPMALAAAKNRWQDFSDIPIEDLPPQQLAKLLLGDNLIVDLLDPNNKTPKEAKQAASVALQAIRHFTSQGGSSPNSIASFLKKLDPWVDKSVQSLNAEYDDSITLGASFLQKVIDNLDDPTKVDELLFRTGIDDRSFFNKLGPSALRKSHQIGNFLDKDNYSLFREGYQSDLYKAFTSLGANKDSLFEMSGQEAGLIGNLSDKWLGQANPGRTRVALEEGFLAQKMAHGVIQKNNGLGGYRSLVDAAHAGQKSFDDFLSSNINDPHYSSLFRRVRDLGMSASEFKRISAGIFSEGEEGIENYGKSNLKKLGELAIALDSHEDLLSKARGDLSARGKILEQYQNALEALDFSTERRAELSLRMAQDGDLLSVLQDRFRMGHPWRPQAPQIDPLNSSSWYSLISTNPVDFMEGSLKDNLLTMAGRGFGVKDYLSSLADPTQPLGYLAALTQVLYQMPQHIANKVGLGLNPADRATTLRTALSFYGKRILPIIGAHLAYNQTNETLHDLGLPAIPDAGANLVANFNILGARVKDFIGFTDFSQGIVNQFPGLDQYFSPRSEEEYREHLYYGEEEVREGRLWFFGSRSPAMGDRIKYVRPSFYRRWKSRWNEDDYSDTYDPENPYNKNAKARKLLRDAGPNLTINSDGSFGALALGELGAGLLASLGGGGYDMTFGSYQGKGGGGRGRGGSGGGRGAMPTGGSVNYGKQGEGGYSYALGYEVPYGAEEGSPINIGYSRGYLDAESFNILDIATAPIHMLRKASGLYGSFIQRFPLYPDDSGGFRNQDPNAQLSWKRTMFLGEYGELGTLNLGEFFRRFANNDNQALDAPSYLINNAPSWLPERFKTGNMYLRTPGIGELNLPSDAYQRANPWSRPLRVRGSSLGLSEEELIRKWLNPMEPLEGEDADDIVEFGSALHQKVQRQMNEYGILVAAETSIYDEKHNISGTIDAIVKTANGEAVMDIKTQGAKSWGNTPEKYIDQITAYMALTGLKQGYLTFVNRDDPDQIRVESFAFDPARWSGILNRIDRARAAVGEMVESGQISPFETYDLLSRIDILSKVAPGSPEFRRAVQFAEESGGFGGFEKQRFDQAKRRAKRLQEQHRTYPYRYGVNTTSENLMIEAISPNGDIITDYGTVRLAGVNFDNQAFAYESPEEVLGKFGVIPGKVMKMTFIDGGFNPEVMADTPVDVLIGNVNKKLVRSDYAGFDKDSKSPLAYKMMYGDDIIPSLFEKAVHLDLPIFNKFLRVRSPLEQFERGEVFGIDRASWDRPYDTIIEPTISSLARKNPFIATAQGAFIGSLFFSTKLGKGTGATAGAVVGAAASLGSRAIGLLTGKEWTPGRYNKQAKFDEYWDILEFIKYSTLAEAAKKKAKKEENTDLDKLAAEKDRTKVALGSWGTLALWAERKAKGTMYGFDPQSGSLQQALAAVPSRHRQIAEEIILHGTLKEKKKYYNLLSNAEKRVLGKFLNADSVPDRPKLSTYFKQHYLPDSNWHGWSPKVNDEDLRTRAAASENLVIETPSRARYQRARAFTSDVSIPKMNHPTLSWINARLNAIMRDGGIKGITAETAFIPSDFNSVAVDMDVFEDDSSKIMENIRRQM